MLRSNSLSDLLTDREILFELIAQEASQQGAAPPAPENDPSYCSLHNTQMKERTGKNGNKWFDHRWQDEHEVWHICNGKTEKTQQ